jgi:hypothetical protein
VGQKLTVLPERGKSAGLEIDQDLTFQQGLWAFQRFGWGVIACLVIAAALGLFGSGPLASRTLASPKETFSLEYERFLRQRSESRLRLHVPPQARSRDEARVWYERSLLERVAVSRIMPPPLRTETDAQGVTYIFRVVNQAEPVLITFFLEPQTFGVLSGRIGIAPDDALDVRQFVYP